MKVAAIIIFQLVASAVWCGATLPKLESVVCAPANPLTKCTSYTEVKQTGVNNAGVFKMSCPKKSGSGEEPMVLKVYKQHSAITSFLDGLRQRTQNLQDAQAKKLPDKLVQVANPFNRWTRLRVMLEEAQGILPLVSVCKSDEDGSTMAVMPEAQPVSKMDGKCLAEVAHAIGWLGSRGIVHNDIQLSNIMMFHDKCVLIDHDLMCTPGDLGGIVCILSHSDYSRFGDKREGDVAMWFKLVEQYFPGKCPAPVFQTLRQGGPSAAAASNAGSAAAPAATASSAAAPAASADNGDERLYAQMTACIRAIGSAPAATVSAAASAAAQSQSDYATEISFDLTHILDMVKAPAAQSSSGKGAQKNAQSQYHGQLSPELAQVIARLNQQKPQSKGAKAAQQSSGSGGSGSDSDPHNERYWKTALQYGF